MKIFITGATGFIGTELVKELLAQGHIVNILYRDPNRIRFKEEKNLVLFQGDILNKESLENAMQGCEVVFHLAAYAKVWSKDPAIFHKINVEGTRNVLSKALQLKVKKVVITSTASVQGPSDMDPVDENKKREKKFFTEYEKTKFQAETEIKYFYHKGLDIVTLLPTRVFGPGLLSESNSVTILIRKYISGTWHFLPGTGKKVGNYVFVKDVVKGHVLAMNKNVAGERFILGGTDIDYSGFFNAVAKAAGKKQWMVPLPVFLILFTSWVMWLLASMFNITPLLTPGWARKYLHNWRISSQKAIDKLDYNPTPLDIGLKETVNWLKSNYVE